MATFTVTNFNDAGAGSLRQAITDANNTAGADVVEFADTLSGGTVELTSGELLITDALTINGLGADNLTIDANKNSRVFNINDGTNAVVDVLIDGVKITGGAIGANGGGVFNAENLTIENSTISGNKITGKYSSASGGGIYSSGTLTLENSLVTNNKTSLYGYGGGVSGTNITLIETEVKNNTARMGGGLTV